MSGIKKSCIMLVVLPALLAVTTTAHAYTRYCKASFKIVAKYANKTTVYPFTFSASASSWAPIFKSLRIRAYERARDCMEAAVDDDYDLPAECTTGSIHGYPDRLFGYEGAAAACSAWGLAPGTSITVKVYGYVWGDEGCGGKRPHLAPPSLPRTPRYSDTFLIDSSYRIYCR